jgi:hypothetical protein
MKTTNRLLAPKPSRKTVNLVAAVRRANRELKRADEQPSSLSSREKAPPARKFLGKTNSQPKKRRYRNRTPGKTRTPLSYAVFDAFGV